jgi:predicted amidohydrolase
VLKVVTLRCVTSSNVRYTCFEIASIVKDLLEDVGMSLENVVVYVTDNASNAIKTAKDLFAHHTIHLMVEFVS